MGFVFSEYGLFALTILAAAVAMVVYPLLMEHMTMISQTYVRIITGVSADEQVDLDGDGLPVDYHAHE